MIDKDILINILKGMVIYVSIISVLLWLRPNVYQVYGAFMAFSLVKSLYYRRFKLKDYIIEGVSLALLLFIFTMARRYVGGILGALLVILIITAVILYSKRDLFWAEVDKNAAKLREMKLRNQDKL